MGYYIRLLSPSKRVVSLNKLHDILAEKSLRASIALETGTAETWTAILLAHNDGPAIAAIERNPVGHGTLGADEIEEFLEEFEECKPKSAAKWLSKYLPTVKTVYAFQFLPGTDVDNGAAILGAVVGGMHDLVGGVVQADGEGFTDDEQRDHILWQFSERAKGPWRMAVLRDGKWVRFEMELSNRKHRRAFFRGAVPAGVRILNQLEASPA